MTNPTLARALRVTAPPPPPRGHLLFGESPGALDRIEVTGRWIERAGRAWIPITGEIHYSRLPRGRWDEILGHSRAGGLDSVATYVFWAAHEPEPGRFDWTGNLDLRAFVELAADHGLDVIVRLGPWSHGEYRNGGFPDWIADSDLNTRTNDPDYLALVRRLYAQTIAQLEGLGHAEGGPVIGAQVENELYDQPEHLATLREIAEECGLRVPLWTATGWGGAQVPETLLPVYSAYSEAFWEDETTEWSAFAASHFRYGEVRDDLTVGADLRESLDGVAAADPAGADDRLPFTTCELGGGMHVAYHRRPLVSSEDIAALALAKIGSGSAWQGYYLYSGGTQRTGPHGTEQESQATGYPNDVPSLSYDFYAPIGEHGQIRPHHHYLRRQHLWLRAEGHRVATLTTTVGGGGDAPDEPRWAVRSDGHSGYLFVTTYQPKRPLAAQPGAQFTVAFDDAEVTVPTAPTDIPAGHSLVWPLRYELTPDLELRSATAQLLTRIKDDEGRLVVLAATDGIPVEIVLGDGTAVDLPGPPGPDCVVELPGVRLLILDETSANRLYRLDLAGRDRLVLSDAPVRADGGDLVVQTESEHVTVAILPAPAGLDADRAELSGPLTQGPWRSWAVTAHRAGPVPLAVEHRPEHGPAPEPRRGGPMNRLGAPDDYTNAATVHIDIPPEAFAADRTLLRLEWTGDVGRAYVGDRLVSDHFWHGRAWDVDLTPHREAAAEHGVRLELLPWRRATGVWVDPTVREVDDGIAIEAATAVRVDTIRLGARKESS
ncbi:beta-galactosidase [Glycomyces salinus]|uniref:beta-galactosidase n=1 Tax=Glycomyces salinus TaxID=980294 RepID=UPI0018EBDF9A|nr:beta-galactosidase [Glycomyces salinus]